MPIQIEARDRTFISKYNLCEAIQRHTGAASFPLQLLHNLVTPTKKRALGGRRRRSTSKPVTAPQKCSALPRARPLTY